MSTRDQSFLVSTVALAEARPERKQTLEPDEPPTERPAARSALRWIFVIVGTTGFLFSFVASGMTLAGPDFTGTQSTLRTLCLAIAAVYFALLIMFSYWSHLARRDAIALQARTDRGTVWRFGWVLIPIIAAPISFEIADRGHAADMRWAFVLLIVARILTLRSLGIQLARVVQRAKRKLVPWGIIIGFTDIALIGIATYGFVDLEPQRERLGEFLVPASFLFLLIAVFCWSYTGRIERGLRSTWDDRYTMSRERAAAQAAEAISQHGADDLAPVAFASRRMVPTAPLRYLVMLSYWAVGAAALYGGWTVWSLRDELTFSTDPEAALDRLWNAVFIASAALLTMQMVQGVWSVAQAWNAQRATMRAPQPIGMFALFLPGPALVLVALSASNPDLQFVMAAFAGLVNLICWGLSFKLLGRTMRALGRSGSAFNAWAVAISAHWALGLLSRPLQRLDDQSYAIAAVVISVVDAGIFVVASLFGWRAMKQFEAATRDHEQIRRVKV